MRLDIIQRNVFLWHHIPSNSLISGVKVINGLLPNSTKPLPESVLIYYQLDHKNNFSVKF